MSVITQTELYITNGQYWIDKNYQVLEVVSCARVGTEDYFYLRVPNKNAWLLPGCYRREAEFMLKHFELLPKNEDETLASAIERHIQNKNQKQKGGDA